VAKQIELEKIQMLTAEGERALELMGRAIRMAGYRNPQSFTDSARANGMNRKNSSNTKASASKDSASKKSSSIHLQKAGGFQGSDAFWVKHELSDGVDRDCIGNVITVERTKNKLAQHGFLVERQAGIPKGLRVNGGSLICQSLDRHGKLQNTTLMNGIQHFSIQEKGGEQGKPAVTNNASRLFTIELVMADGKGLERTFTRTFATRN
jgi:hypothetical protein